MTAKSLKLETLKISPEIEKIENIKKSFYDDNKLIEILNQIFYINTDEYREFAFLSNNNVTNLKTLKLKTLKLDRNLRAITFSNLFYLKKTLEYNYFFINKCNLYCSVNRLSRIPLFPFSSERVFYTRKFFKNDYEKHITHSDIFFDFDLKIIKKNTEKSFSKFINEILFFINLFLEKKINFTLNFSGSKGFKFFILQNSLNFKQVREFYFLIEKIYKPQFLDNFNMFLPSKLMKISNTLVFKDDKINIASYLYEENYNLILQHILKNSNFDIFSYFNQEKYNEIFGVYNRTFFNKNIVPNFEHEKNIKIFFKDLKKMGKK